jgi:hypothetical protein
MLFLILFVVASVLLVLLVFLLGFRLGGEHWQSEVARVRLQAAQAERHLHNLAREAFISMAEAVEQQRDPK